MKASEAPEKIYISNFDIEALPKNEQLSERWHEAKTQDTDIEYIRKDAFIEKASEWIETNVEYYMKADKSCSIPMCPQFSKIDFIEKFKKAMKL